MGKGRHAGKSIDSELSRKDKRKMLKKEKKQKRIAYHEKKSIEKSRIITNVVTKHNNVFSNNKKNNSIVQKKANTQKAQNIPAMKPQNQSITKSTIKKTITSQNVQATNLITTKPLKVQKKKTKQQLQNQAQIQRQQKQIQYYEKLLGVNKKKNKYKGIAKGLGYEDDLFDFLDGISNRVKQSGDNTNVMLSKDNGDQQQQEYGEQQYDEMQAEDYDEEDNSQQQQQQYSNQQQIDQMDNDNEQQSQSNQQYSQEQDENQQGIQQQNDYQGDDLQQQDQQNMYEDDNDMNGEQQDDQQMMQMWNNLDKQQVVLKKGKNNNKNVNMKHQQHHPKINHQLQQKTQPNRRPSLFGNMSKQQKQQLEIRKQMNGIFNKLSDGNLMISFRQFSEIFISASKSATIPVFIDLFKRFNVGVEKPHLHILLSNIALASSLHHLMGNRLMAPLTYQLIKEFSLLQSTPQNLQQIQQIGYSKIFQRKKNIILIFSYLYHFGSLTGEFIHSLVKHLSQSLNQHNVEFLYLIIQKIGSKIRQNDPGILKNIIETLRESIQKFKSLVNQQSTHQLSKINIIQTQLNELKFNRKVELFSDQRMAFFATFLSKNIPKQLNTEKQVFLPSFQQIKNANTSTTTWWENLQNNISGGNSGLFEQNEEDIEMINQITKQRKKLLQLAKSLNLVTQIRKNIFVQIMESSDYLQAAQRVLALRIKNLHQIAVVLIQTCILEPTFNPYYPLVAAKIANINPKFKSKVQFTIWDQIKLLESYDARKTSNLAKFTARFIGNSLTDGSLSILKYFPDFINVHPSQAMFMMIFFTEFLNVAKKQTLAQMSTKLKESSNSSVKDSILEYLKQVGVREKGFNNMDKMKFLRRMIMLNEKQDDDGERF